ncbi:MAG: tRNA (N(6)-L-threonylcarbamoyladenosine(37)-C(2))-methylthiotransferase MtaB [Rickettsiales bacterium]|jgi:threonylcarbamoyladenosine tRNA methylthiotransferase MtaB|nr:tRNA (N(6)-L-threonylcarbamoyladenosine(37)-C(2))-methylthiotransferase MtaB [Rickettsiales bacterium]
MKLEIVNFGCRLNTYESEVIKELFRERNIVLDEGRDLVLFNSCVVTEQAEKQLSQSIRKVRRERGDNIIIGVIGCAIQINSKKYLNMPEVDFVVGNNNKLEISSYLNFSKNREIVSDVFAQNTVSNSIITGFENRSRAFIQIQNGCDNKCTFCLTRLARGPSVSNLPAKIIEQVKKLVDNGYNEIVLTGVDISDYGKGLDEKMNLGLLVKKILKETVISRLRISSVDIDKLNVDLVEVYQYEKRLIPHIHLSLQSGDDMILTRMLRRHRQIDIFNKSFELREKRKELIFGADFIAGFPTETEEMHKNSIKVIQQTPITFGHIFPYSRRQGTKAALMPQIDKSTKKRRAKELRIECEKNLNVLKESVKNTKQMVLVESEYKGRLDNYLLVDLKQNYKDYIGKIIEVEL